MKWNPFSKKKSFEPIGRFSAFTTIEDIIFNYFGQNISQGQKGDLIKAGKGFVYTCSTFISNSVASQELHLYSPAKRSRSKELTKQTKRYLTSNISNVKNRIKNIDETQEVMEHDAIELLRNINSYSDGFKFMSSSEFQKCLCGDSYWYAIGEIKPIELHLLPPEQVEIIEKKGKDENGNEYFRQIDKYMVGKTPFKPKEIIHFSYVNPRVDGDNWKYGMSPLEAVVAEYNISGKLKDLQFDFASSKPANQIYLQTDKDQSDYTPEQKKAIKEAYEEFTSGGNKARKLMVIDKAGKLVEIPHSAKDLPFIDNLKGFREFIFNAYQVPISFVENSGSNRAIQDRQDTQYLTHCIYPKLMLIQSTLNSFLIPLYPDLEGCFFAYENCIPEDELNQLKIDTGYVGSGIWSPNDVLIRQDKETFDGGDTHFINGVPIGSDPERDAKTLVDAIKKQFEKE